MERKIISSHELMSAAGTVKKIDEKIPLEHRHLLITSVLESISAQKLRKVFTDNGVDASARDVLEWLQSTRKWLGIPPANRGKPSAEYLQTIQEWRQANDNPTLEEIDAGWIPASQRGAQEEPRRQKLSPKYERMLQEFREMLASFDGVTDDEEVKRLLDQHLKKMKTQRSKLA